MRAAFGFGAERAQAAEPAGVVDREREQARQALDEVLLLAPVHLGHDVFERDEPDERAAGAQRRVEAAAGQRREPAFVGMHEPVVDEDRVRGW